jgi:signal transduction histidine kinase
VRDLLRSFVKRLPPWLGSIRMRLTLLYSFVLFGLAALVVGGIYLTLSRTLDEPTVSRSEQFVVQNTDTGPRVVLVQREQTNFMQVLENEVNQRALDTLRTHSFVALGILFVGSLGVGWFVAGRVLRPIGRITEVARDIQATDLSRRIAMDGPNDELQQLADTFDAMLARLDEAFESQRRFIHEASHELRNPLAVIRTNLDVALDDPNATVEDLRDTAVVVHRSAERMTSLVDDLLVYARQETPQQRRDTIDLADLMQDAAEEFEAAAASEDVELTAAGGAGALVSGDPTALGQAVANLLANAIRVSPPGGRIRVASGVDEGWVWAAVEDEGPGIAEEDRPRVWQRFWRGDRTMNRMERRSGLGLTIVRSVVDAHHGHVRLFSEIGAGSTFVLWFPRAEYSDTEADALPPEPSGGFNRRRRFPGTNGTGRGALRRASRQVPKALEDIPRA